MNEEKVIFCTYFDKFYLLKGLSMYQSLKEWHKGVQLWILCMDSYTYLILRKMRLKGVRLISLREFEDQKLIGAKADRSSLEYYWTCTPSLPLFVFRKNKDCSHVIYVDADMYFFSSAEAILDELDNNSIFITEHRFPKSQTNRIETQGRFNVGILAFKNDMLAVKCLDRWRQQCIDWCYFKEEDGKMGDQMYLNEWPNLYNKLTISQNFGVNTGPWNILQYRIKQNYKKIYVQDNELICYHFHQFRIIGDNKFINSVGYDLSTPVRNSVYERYAKEIEGQLKILKSYDKAFSYFDSDSRSQKSKFPRLVGFFKLLYEKI